MDSGYSNLIINDISKKYKSDSCLENLNYIPLWNFLIKKIQKIKMNQNLEGSKNPSRLIPVSYTHLTLPTKRIV